MLGNAARTLWNWTRTLRFRLAAWNALVVLATTLCILMGIREGVRWTLLHEMDEILLEDIKEIQLTLHQPEPEVFTSIQDDLRRKAEGHERHGWFVELYDSTTERAWSTMSQEALLPDITSVPFEVPTSVGLYRVVRTKVPNHLQFSEIQVGAKLDFLSRALAHIDWLVSWIFGAAIVLAPAIGYILARGAANVIGEMIDAASRLRPDHLMERLPVRDTGDELDHMAITVNKLLDRIAVYLQQKRDFLANAAHELRTPLAAVRSSVEVALSGNPTTNEYQELLTDIIEQSSALETLVNQLLLLSETENTDLVVADRTCELDKIVRRAVDMFEGVAESEQVKLTLTAIDDVTILGDRQHWRQVVNNLLDNAIKYTPHGGHVTVSLTHDPQQQGAVLRVRDTGIGIPKQDIGKIFDRFFRADRARTHNPRLGGSGLGLSICKAVVEAHRGTISCESTPNVGTTMTVRILCACCVERAEGDTADSKNTALPRSPAKA